MGDATSRVGGATSREGPPPDPLGGRRGGVGDGSRAPFPGGGSAMVAVGAWRGGARALIRVLSGLPGGFPAAIVIVQHLDPRHRSLIADIFGRRTALKV